MGSVYLCLHRAVSWQLHGGGGGVTEHGEQPLCPVWEETRAAELLCCLAWAYLRRTKHPAQIFLGWCLEVKGAAGAGGAWAVSFVGNAVLVCAGCSGSCWLVVFGGCTFLFAKDALG